MCVWVGVGVDSVRVRRLSRGPTKLLSLSLKWMSYYADDDDAE